ncbi:mitochondrial genome maintenance MGM101-domain-containing protein [Cunninghamella echinulata]|nr:mitochondrial genome maintenance MGM101-domain-containing protein [Cunninghamella echinulata]
MNNLFRTCSSFIKGNNTAHSLTVRSFQRGVSTTRFVKPTKSITTSAKAAATTSKTETNNNKNNTTTSVTTQEKNNENDVIEALNDKSYFPGTEQFDAPKALEIEEEGDSHNWATSFHGLSTTPFSSEISNVLQQEINPNDVEIKPDGLLYLPEIKYRRILNKAFGPGGWGLAPRGEHSISTKNISREYALICHGRFVSQARGEQDFFDIAGLPTASEGCKSNALMRCCKDLGIASELWDPVFIRKFKKKYCVEVWAEHITTKRKKKLWRKKDDVLEYPYKET